MLEQPTGHINTRRNRQARHPRRLTAIVLTIALLSLSVLAGVIGWSTTHHEKRTDMDIKDNVAKKSHGRIVVVGSTSCRKIDFNNRTGQLHDTQAIPCPEIAPGGKYHYPSARLEGISQGFSSR